MRSIFNKNILAMVAIALGAVACQPEIENIPEPSKGQADFSKYVALGNSLTAGYADGALYADAQRNSFPAIIAKQLEAVGGATDFRQPLIPEGTSFQPSATGEGKLVLHLDSAAPFRVPGLSVSDYSTSTLQEQGPYTNIGIPGATVSHLTTLGYGMGNPYFGKMLASSPGASATSTPVQYAISQSPTFFTLWIGNNDILGYATSGGVAGSITAPSTFSTEMDEIINELKAANPSIKGAVANIPSVTNIPFFNYIRWNQFELEQANADQLNAVIKGMVTNAVKQQVAAGLVAQGAFPDLPSAINYLENDPTGKATLTGAVNATILDYKGQGLYPEFNAGPNGFLVEVDQTVSPLGIKQLTANEKILLTAAKTLKSPAFTLLPIVPNQFALDNSELGAIETARSAYNAKIKQITTNHGLAHVDAAALLDRVQAGTNIDGIGISSTFVTGGAFSLDGVHLTSRGSAIVANEFIKSINAAYGANIPRTSPSQYEGVLLP